MPTFMLAAGVVSAADINTAQIKRQFVGVLLPGAM